MSETPLLADLLKTHLAATGSSARALAERLDASYPSVLAWLSKGGVPRKAEHREGLRRELALAPDVFARVIAASSKDPIDVPMDGPLDLRQLLIKHLGERNLTERTFADIAGVPYATLMGISRRGAVPRQDALVRLAQALGLSIEIVREAASRTRGEAEAAGHPVEVTDDAGLTEQPPTGRIVVSESAAASPPVDPADPGQQLARIARERVAASGLTAAAYARTHGLPYLALSKLLSTGVEPEQPEVQAELRAAFPATRTISAASVGAAQPRSNEGSRALRRADATDAVADHPLHEALLRLVRERGWTQQRFAQESGLAAPTAAKLLRGELPGRGPTHEKLRTVLGLDAAGYAALLPPTPHVSEDAPAPRREVRPESPEDAESARLVRAVGELDGDQRAAVWKLVKAFRDR